MIKKLLFICLLTAFSFGLSAQIDFDGVLPEGFSVAIEEHQVHSTTEGVATLDGYTTYRLYVNCIHPDDRITIVYGIEGLETQINFSGDLYQNGSSFGGITPTIPCAFLAEAEAADPESIYDSWVTLGLYCSGSTDPDTGLDAQPAQAIGATWGDVFEAGGDIIINDEDGGSWFSIAGADDATNTVAGDDLQIMIGQFTTTGDISGVLTFTIFPEGAQGVNTYEINEYPFPEGLLTGCTDSEACNYDSTAELDNASCIYECAITLDEVITTNALCPTSANGGVSIDVSGGQEGLLYTIVDGPSNNSGIFTNVLLPGEYAYQVTDNSFVECGGTVQCMIEGTFVVGPDPFVVDLDISEITCYNANTGSYEVTGISGGTGPYTVDIDTNDGGTEGPMEFIPGTNINDGLPNGNYDYKVFDSNGCQFVGTLDLFNPTQITLDVASTNAECGNDPNGTIDLCGTTGGTTPYMFSIDNGDTFTEDCLFEGLVGATYSIDVTDAGGCNHPGSSVTLLGPAPISFELDEIVPATWCELTESFILDSLGSVSITDPMGGTGNLNVFWTSAPTGYVYTPGVDSPFLTGCIPGDYTVQVSDALGCIYELTFTVEQVSSQQEGCLPVDFVIENFNNIALSLYPNPSNGNFELFLDGLNGEKVAYSVIDGLGRVITSTELGNRAGLVTERIDITTEANGFYYLQVTVNGQTKTVKLIKED